MDDVPLPTVHAVAGPLESWPDAPVLRAHRLAAADLRARLRARDQRGGAARGQDDAIDVAAQEAALFGAELLRRGLI